MRALQNDLSFTTDDIGNTTPLDVHAKIFQPTPQTPRQNPPITYMKSMSAEASHLPSNDTSQRMQLDPYHSMTEITTQTVAASYNRNEINKVFGDDLPSPTYCQTHKGTTNGEIQFCIHPNGDVSARQWSESLYQWINVGQYSNIRKRTEGQLANERLRGETEGHSLLQNTLVYFRAIAKQREASVMGLPFGSAEIEACFSKRPQSRLPATGLAASLTSLANVDAMSYAGKVSNRHHDVNGLEMVSKPQFGIFEPSPSPSPPFGKDELDTIFFQTTPTPSPRSHRRPILTRKTGDERPEMPGADSTTTMSLLEHDIINESIGVSLLHNSKSHHVPSLPNPLHDSRIAIPSMHSTRRPALATHISPDFYDLSYMVRAGLQQIPVNTMPSRSMPAPGRTVMHDPLQNVESQKQNLETGMAYGHSHDYVAEMQPSRLHLVDDVFHMPKQQYTSSRETRNLHWNEPTKYHDEEMNYTSRLNAKVGSSADGPILKGPPIPQDLDHENINRAGQVKDVLKRDRDLYQWFTDGNKVARQEDVFHRIISLDVDFVENNTVNHKSDHGVIGQPRSEIKTTTILEQKEESRSDKTRLLVPLYENLAAYLEGPTKKRHGYWAPFVDAPESAIDRSINGKNSFFDDEDKIESGESVES